MVGAALVRGGVIAIAVCAWTPARAGRLCAVPCAEFNTPCKSYYCDSGSCKYVYRGYGETCVDINNPCLVGVCDFDAPFGTGGCLDASRVVCPPPDQCHDPGTCDSTTGTCEYPAKEDGTPCDDDDACTRPDACTAGVCAGVPVVCEPIDECHAAGTCDPGTGSCSNPTAPAGHSCTTPQGTASTCDIAGDCLPAGTCGNGVVEPPEECELGDGDCCAPAGGPNACHFRGPTEPCGGVTPVCVEPRLCTGTRSDCPVTPTFQASGMPCFPDDSCTIGGCDGHGTCDPRGTVCAAAARATNNGTRNVRIRVTCRSSARSECEAHGVAMADAATNTRTVSAADAGEEITEAAQGTTRRRTGHGGLRFKTVLVLRLNARGRELLRERAVDAGVMVTIRGQDHLARVDTTVRLLRLLHR